MSSRLVCPTCGLANSMSSLFCRRCGSQLVPDVQTPDTPTPAPETTNQTKKCASCGQVNDGQNVRCLRCGNDLN